MKRVGLAACVAVSMALLAPGAHAAIAERVVAVVGEHPIFWTELQHRAVEARMQIRTQTSDPNVVSVQEQGMYEELLDRMIADRLEAEQAERAHVRVAAGEIDLAIANIAAQARTAQGQSVTVGGLMAVVRSRGLTDEDFREEIRRQLLEGKLLELRVRPARPSDRNGCSRGVRAMAGGVVRDVTRSPFRECARVDDGASLARRHGACTCAMARGATRQRVRRRAPLTRRRRSMGTGSPAALR
jgi:hypothetical protein